MCTDLPAVARGREGYPYVSRYDTRRFLTVKLSATGKGRHLHYHCPNTFRNIPHVRVRYINRKIVWEASILSYTLKDVYLRQTSESLRCPTTDIQFQVKTGTFLFAIMQSHIQRCLLKDFSQDGGRRVWNWRHFRLVPMVKKLLLATSCMSVCLPVCVSETARLPPELFL